MNSPVYLKQNKCIRSLYVKKKIYILHMRRPQSSNQIIPAPKNRFGDYAEQLNDTPQSHKHIKPIWNVGIANKSFVRVWVCVAFILSLLKYYKISNFFSFTQSTSGPQLIAGRNGKFVI